MGEHSRTARELEMPMCAECASTYWRCTPAYASPRVDMPMWAHAVHGHGSTARLCPRPWDRGLRTPHTSVERLSGRAGERRESVETRRALPATRYGLFCVSRTVKVSAQEFFAKINGSRVTNTASKKYRQWSPARVFARQADERE